MPDFQESSQQPKSIEEQINELLGEFSGAASPQQKNLAELAKQAQANQKSIETSVGALHELIDYLRVCIKYQAFDLEATRRERDYLRKLLEEQDNRPHQQEDGNDHLNDPDF